jgi:hypothetical protein
MGIASRLRQLRERSWRRSDPALATTSQRRSNGAEASGHPTFDRLINGETITLMKASDEVLGYLVSLMNEQLPNGFWYATLRDVDLRLQWAVLVDLTKDLPDSLAILMLDDLELGLWVPQVYMEDMRRKWLSNN